VFERPRPQAGDGFDLSESASCLFDFSHLFRINPKAFGV